MAWLGRPLAGAARRHLGAAVRGAGALAVRVPAVRARLQLLAAARQLQRQRLPLALARLRLRLLVQPLLAAASAHFAALLEDGLLRQVFREALLLQHKHKVSKVHVLVTHTDTFILERERKQALSLVSCQRIRKVVKVA